jgi:hypothetical protein
MQVVLLLLLLLLLLVCPAHRTCAHPLLAPTGTLTMSLSAVLVTVHVLVLSTVVVTPLMLTANTCCCATAGAKCAHAADKTISTHAAGSNSVTNGIVCQQSVRDRR